MLEQYSVTDATTGRAYLSIGKSGSNTTHNYFTAMSWLNDSQRLVATVNVDPKGTRGDYVLYDLQTGRTEPLPEDVRWGGGAVSFGNILYYLKDGGIRGYDPAKGDDFLVYASPDKEFFGPLSVTNDGRMLGVFWKSGEDWSIGRLEAATGRLLETLTPGFAKPYSMANHAMINPVEDNLIFFAHEGTTQFIPDRIWLWDIRQHGRETASGAANLYRQRPMSDGQLGEYIGHEAWSWDGERLYFVKYSSSPLAPTGICYVTRQGAEFNHVNGDYRHWHVCPSPDGKWTVSDTEADGGTSSHIVLTEVATGKAEVLCTVKRWPNHPGHPHPSFSPDSRKITFTCADENNCLRIGCMEI